MTRGRSYCNAVESYDCEAPAGIRTGNGVGSLPGVKRSELYTCGYCDEPVCGKCSDVMTPPAFFKNQAPVRVCLLHSPNELATWLGLV